MNICSSPLLTVLVELNAAPNVSMFDIKLQPSRSSLQYANLYQRQPTLDTELCLLCRILEWRVKVKPEHSLWSLPILQTSASVKQMRMLISRFW